jgi:hypothetical protein
MGWLTGTKKDQRGQKEGKEGTKREQEEDRSGGYIEMFR